MEKEENSLVSFKDVFPVPFTLKSAGRVHDANGNFCMDIVGEDEIENYTLILKLNGKLPEPPTEGNFYITDECSTKVYFKYNNGATELVIRVRGWGRLTGGNGLKLDHDVAYKLQVDFAKWLVETLNNGTYEAE